MYLILLELRRFSSASVPVGLFFNWPLGQSSAQGKFTYHFSGAPEYKAEFPPTYWPLLLRASHQGHKHPVSLHCRSSIAHLLSQWISDKYNGSLQFNRSPEDAVRQSHECPCVAPWSNAERRETPAPGRRRWSRWRGRSR